MPSGFLPPFKRGLTNASVSPSAKMFKANTVKRIITPAKVVAHHAPFNTMLRPSERMLPHEGCGGCTPAPKKESEASNTIASATITVAKTKTGAAVLRTTCLRRI